MDKMRAPIWNYFTIASNDAQAKCTVPGYQQVIKRGQNKSNYSTTALINHLRLKHRVVYQEFEAQQSESTRPITSTVPANQPSILIAFDQVRVWPYDNSNSRTITRKIAELIVQPLDVQPISIVEDTGFKELLKTLEPRYRVPSRVVYSKRN